MVLREPLVTAGHGQNRGRVTERIFRHGSIRNGQGEHFKKSQVGIHTPRCQKPFDQHSSPLSESRG